MSSPHFSSDRRGSETRARVKSPYARKAKRGGLAFSPTPLPFSLPPYPLPLSTPATQATANALHSSGMGGSAFPGALRQELYSLCKDLTVPRLDKNYVWAFRNSLWKKRKKVSGAFGSQRAVTLHPITAFTGRLHQKGVPFSGIRYIKG